MPKRKKRRQNDSSRAMQQALDHYECALRNLEDADERAALEALDFAEVFLERAQDDDVRQGLVAEVSLARGALLEVADPRNARLAYARSFSADGNAAAALRAARLAWRCGDDEAACEALLERARRGGGRRGSSRRRGGAAGALPRGARPGPRGSRIGGARLRPDLFQEGADECVEREIMRRRPRAPLRRRPAGQSPGGAPAGPATGGPLLARDGLRLARRRLF